MYCILACAAATHIFGSSNMYAYRKAELVVSGYENMCWVTSKLRHLHGLGAWSCWFHSLYDLYSVDCEINTNIFIACVVCLAGGPPIVVQYYVVVDGGSFGSSGGGGGGDTVQQYAYYSDIMHDYHSS